MAINPINKNWGCPQKMLSIVNDDSTIERDTADVIRQDFEVSPDYELVYVNGNMDKMLKTWMSDGNTQDKLLGFKKMLSYPYYKIAFNIGDYVYFDYYSVGMNNKDKWSCWILMSLDYQNYYDVNGRAYPCNEYLKWKDNNSIIEYPLYMEDSMKYTTLNLGTQGVTEPDCDNIAFVQRNKDTESIYINQRFLFEGRAYVVVQKNIEISKKVIKLFLNKVALQPNDDVENNIAWNGNSVIEPVKPTTNGDLMLPEISGIILDEEQRFSIYEYVDGIKTDTTFTVEVMGMDNSYYQFNIIDGNNFSIKNLKQNKKVSLTIKIVNDKTGILQIKEIWLLGVF